ncbi:MAG: DHHA1 domain-containing protein [Candidatus Heimdallarchaeota archaeon]
MASSDTPIEEKLWNQFQTAAKDIGKLIRRYAKNGVTEIISHHDADGLSAAGVLGNMLADLERPFRIRIVKQLDDTAIDYLEGSKNLVIFSDLASSKVDALNERLPGPLVILDHHEVGKENLPERTDFGFLNPHLLGIDGSDAISGAGVAYLVARNLNKANIRLAPLAIVGAIADRQNKGDKHSFTSLNAKIVEEGKNYGVIAEKLDFWVYDAHNLPIVRAIERLGIPELSGVAIQRHLEKELGISSFVGDKKRTIAGLTVEEKRKLGTALIVNFGLTDDQIYRYVYTFPKEDHQRLQGAAEHATLLNSLGRTGNYGVAITLTLGDRRSETIDEAENLLKEYRKQLSSYLQWATLEKIDAHTYGTVYFLDAGHHISDRVIGTVASILVSREKVLQDRPLLAVAAVEDNQLKLSGRIARSLEGKYSLATIFRQAMEQVLPEGEVGGHDAAAGAAFPKEKLHPFLKRVNTILKSQQGEEEDSAGETP